MRLCPGVLRDGAVTPVKLLQLLWILLLPVVVSHTVQTVYIQKYPLTASHPSCLFLLLQIQPPSLSLCFCCCCWRCWRLAPSCGISGECEGETGFQTWGANFPLFLIWFSRLRYISTFFLLFLFDNHLFPVSQVSMAGQISFTILAVTS